MRRTEVSTGYRAPRFRRPGSAIRAGAIAAAFAMQFACVALPMPAAAMQLLEAVDHAELRAEVSATEVNRIALIGDRVLRVVRAPDGYAVEHDAATGDLWLRRVGSTASAGTPVTLFLGTEKGFTYRLTLTPSDRDAAQVLIRNRRAMPAQDVNDPGPALSTDPHIAALVKLVRAVARREPLAAYAIHAGLAGGDSFVAAGVRLIETWRGPRFRALVFEAGRSAPVGGNGPAGLAGTIEETLAAGRVAALWLAAPGTGPTGGRLAVAVVETARAETPR